MTRRIVIASCARRGQPTVTVETDGDLYYVRAEGADYRCYHTAAEALERWGMLTDPRIAPPTPALWCAWHEPGPAPSGTSHGICETCAEKMLADAGNGGPHVEITLP
jgi:hypothetical protein